MTLRRNHTSRLSGFLPAVLLFVLAAFATIYGPFSSGTSFAASPKQSAGGTGTSEPSASQRPLMLAESRVIKAAALPFDGAKAALPADIRLAIGQGFGQPSGVTVVSSVAVDAVHFYRATAPPVAC